MAVALFSFLTSIQPFCASVYDRHALLRFSPIRMHFHRSSLTRTMWRLAAISNRLRRFRYPSDTQNRPRPRWYSHPRCIYCRTAHAQRQFSVFRALRLPPAGRCSHWQSRCVIPSPDRHTLVDIWCQSSHFISLLFNFDSRLYIDSYPPSRSHTVSPKPRSLFSFIAARWPAIAAAMSSSRLFSPASFIANDDGASASSRPLPVWPESYLGMFAWFSRALWCSPLFGDHSESDTEVIVHWLPAVRPLAECDERVRPELYAARVRALLAATLSSSVSGDHLHGCVDESSLGIASLDAVDDVRQLLSLIDSQNGADASSGDRSSPSVVLATDEACELRIRDGFSSSNVWTPLELAQHVDTAHRLHNLFTRFVPPPHSFHVASSSFPLPMARQPMNALRVSQMILLPPRVCLTLFADFARFGGGRSNERLAFHEFCTALGAASEAPLARTLFAIFLNAASSRKFAVDRSSCASSASLMNFAATSWQPPRSHSGDESNDNFSSASSSRAQKSAPGNVSHRSNDFDIPDSEECVDDDLTLDYRWLIVSLALAPHTTAVRECLGAASIFTADTEAASRLMSLLPSPLRNKTDVAQQRPIALPSWATCPVASASSSLSSASSENSAAKLASVSQTDRAILITHVDKCLEWTLQYVSPPALITRPVFMFLLIFYHEFISLPVSSLLLNHVSL